MRLPCFGGAEVRTFAHTSLIALEVCGATIFEQAEPCGHLVFVTKSTSTYIPMGAGISVEKVPFTGKVLCIPDRYFARAYNDHIEQSRVMLARAPIDSPEFIELVRIGLRLAASPDFARWPLIVESLAVAIATSVIKAQAPAANMIGAQTGLSTERKRRVVNYIEANIDKAITLTDLAGVALLSRHHFARSFKAATGISPGRFVVRWRVHQAVKLLRSTSLSLAMVGVMVGFSSQQHFTNAFREIVGMPPGRYRSNSNLAER